MVTAKAKASLVLNQASEDKRICKSGRVKSLKIFSDNEKIKVDASCTKPVMIKKKSTVDYAIYPKSGLKYMEKSKNKCDASGTRSNGRKALADVSNTLISSSQNIVHDGSKPMKRKSEKDTTLQRASNGTGTKTVNFSLRKSLLVKARENSIQAKAESNSSYASTSKVGVKFQNLCSFDRRAKNSGLGCESSLANGRVARTSLIPTRRSLPVLKKVNQENPTISKDNVEISEKARGRVGIPVKGASGRKAILQPSIARSHAQRNRVSDGFIMMGQAKLDTGTLSRKSIKPIIKTTVKVSAAQRTSKSKYELGIIKSTSVSASSSKSEEVMTSALTKNISHESTQGEVPSHSHSNPSTSTDINSRKRTGRRRSYTSLLMTGPKLLEEHGLGPTQEKLPNIDDDLNQLEVAEYVEEIYQYYWTIEAQSPSLENYISMQAEITPHMRAILINWLIEVHFKFDLMHETLFLTITLLDRYLSQVKIKKNEMQLVGLTALLLASKYEDFWHPRVNDLISISAESYTRDQVLQMEALILKKLKFRLNLPTPYVFMLRFLKAAQSNTKLEHLSFYLIELCIVEYEALKFKPSLLCASAIYVARCTLQMTPSWTPLLSKHAHYDVSQMRDCVEMILKFQRSAKLGQLKVTFEKYMKPDFNCVAAIKPLDMLPR